MSTPLFLTTQTLSFLQSLPSTLSNLFFYLSFPIPPFLRTPDLLTLLTSCDTHISHTLHTKCSCILCIPLMLAPS